MFLPFSRTPRLTAWRAAFQGGDHAGSDRPGLGGALRQVPEAGLPPDKPGGQTAAHAGLSRLPPASRRPRCSRLPVRGPYRYVRLLPLPGRCLGGRVRVVSGFRPQTGPMRDDPAGTCLPVSPARAARAGLTGWRAVPCRSRPSGLAVPAGMLPCGLVPVEHASGMPCRPLPAGRAGTGRKSDCARRNPAAGGLDGGVVR